MIAQRAQSAIATTRKPLTWHVTDHEVGALRQRNELAAAYDAAQLVASNLADGDTSRQADAIRYVAELLDVWSQRATLGNVNIEAALESFDDAGPALSEALRMFEEAVQS